jgi:hypothetical protein
MNIWNQLAVTICTINRKVEHALSRGKIELGVIRSIYFDYNAGVHIF